MNKYKFSVVFLSIGLALFAAGWLTPAFVFADHTNEHTISQLLQQVQALQQQILQLQQQTTQQPKLQRVPTTSIQTSSFTYNLYLGLSDSETNGEVSALQRFLAGQPGVYPEGLITGFFGPLTEKAVQRFQKQRGLVSSGSPDTTGYGVVGPRTRALIRELSGLAGTPPSKQPPAASYRRTPPPATQVVNDIQLSANPTSGNAPLTTTLTIDATQFIVTHAQIQEGDYSVLLALDCNADGTFEQQKGPVTAKIVQFSCVYSSAGTYSPLAKVTFEPSEGAESVVYASVDIVVSQTGTQQPSITVISPNGGESYVAGQGSIAINYVSSGIAGKSLTAYLYSPTLGNVRSTSAVAANSGSIIMSLELAGEDPVGQYKIKLCQPEEIAGLCDSSDSFFTLTAPTTIPTIRVLSPNGGEQIQKGQTHTIRWRAPASTPTVAIHLYSSPIPSYIYYIGTITKSVANTGSFSWNTGQNISVYDTFNRLSQNIAVPTGTDLYLLIEDPASFGSATGYLMDMSDAAFRVVSAPPPPPPPSSVTLSASPSSGTAPFTTTLTADALDFVNTLLASIPSYSAWAMQWNFDCNGDGITDKSYRNQAKLQTNVCTYSNAGTYTAQVEVIFDSENKVERASAQTQVVVSAVTPTPSITVISPNGGERWEVGKSYQIRWSTLGLRSDDVVSLEYRFEGMSSALGGVGNVIAQVKNTGSYNWTIPASLEPRRYKIEIIKYGVDGVSDLSDNFFSIVAPTTQQPTISSISPAQGGANTVVTIYGTNLSGATSVKFYTSGGQLVGSIVPSSVSSAIEGPESIVIFTISGLFAANVGPGTYQVGVVVVANTCPGGCNSNRVSFTLTEPVPPSSVTLSASPSSGTAPLTTTLTADAFDFVNTVLASIPSYIAWAVQWNFDCNGDGITDKSYRNQAKLQTNVCTYSNVGTYTAQVEVIFDSENKVERASAQVQVRVTSTAQVPSITVISPNGGETWRPGETHRITWNSNGVDAVRIYVYDSSISGSGSTNYITPNNVSVPASQGYFDWIIGQFGKVNGPPGSGGNNYRIRIDDVAGVVSSDSSDAPFSIVAPATTNQSPMRPTISGPSSLTVGQSGTFSFYSEDPDNDYPLLYNIAWGDGNIKAGDQTFASDGKPVTASHAWSRTGIFTIFVTVTDSRGGTSSNSFVVNVTVTPTPSITVLSPNGGERWEIGKTYQIRWSSTGNVPLVDVTTTEVPSRYIASSIANTGSYTWTIPTTFQVGNYKLRIAEPTDGPDKGIDDSDAAFSIVSPTTVNNAPVIDSVSGPTALQAGQQGTWYVNAHDPESDSMAYSVAWGDGSPASIISLSRMTSVVFNHMYANAGIYNAEFVVSDASGNRVSKFVSVQVQQQPIPSISYLNAVPGTVNSNDTITFSWSSQNAEAVEFSIPCYSGLSIMDALNSQPFSCGVGRRVGTSGSLQLRLANTSNSPISALARALPVVGGAAKNEYAKDVSFVVQTGTPSVSPILVVTAPASGAQWKLGQTYSIAWSTLNVPSGSLVDIYLVGSLNYVVHTIARGINALQWSYSWTIPSGIPPAQYKVQIVCAGNLGCSSTTELFSLVEIVSTQLPDYIVKDLFVGQQLGSVTQLFMVGDSIPLKFVFKNIGGPGPIPAIELVHEGADVVSASNSSCFGMRTMNTGQECTLDLVLKYPTAGTKTISARVDTTNVAQEIDENNNTKVITFTVNPVISSTPSTTSSVASMLEAVRSMLQQIETALRGL